MLLTDSKMPLQSIMMLLQDIKVSLQDINMPFQVIKVTLLEIKVTLLKSKISFQVIKVPLLDMMPLQDIRKLFKTVATTVNYFAMAGHRNVIAGY